MRGKDGNIAPFKCINKDILWIFGLLLYLKTSDCAQASNETLCLNGIEALLMDENILFLAESFVLWFDYLNLKFTSCYSVWSKLILDTDLSSLTSRIAEMSEL